MSGGMRIDDHKFWAGSKGKDSVFPDGPHKTKDYSSAEGAGAVSQYEDTTERIKEGQMLSDRQTKKHPLKNTTRN